MFKFLGKIFDNNEKAIRTYMPRVAQINALEDEMKAKSDAELRAMTGALIARLEEGETLDDILPEAFAAVREASRRVNGQRHFDVQLIGGIVLHEGKIAEMKTGEGKTLVATLPLYLNALTGEGVHLVTVNDYLAQRDARWMGAIYHLLGLSVGVIQHDSAFLYDPDFETERRAVATTCGRSSVARRTLRTSPTARTTSSASITCATTWSSRPTRWSSAPLTSRSWTRSTTS